jgi:hypothetical protein
MTADVTISCPHCRRQYTMKIDPERLQRLKTRATCGRCGKTFDVASRITPPSHEPATEPKLRRYEPPAPVAQPTPTAKPAAGASTVPDLRDEMEELAREFAEAAARFTPVNVKRSALGLPPEPTPTKPATVEPPTQPGIRPASLEPPTQPGIRPASLEPPTQPGIRPASLAPPTEPAVTVPPEALAPVVSPPAASPPAASQPPATASPPAAAPSPTALSLEAEPADEAEIATVVPPRSPKSWLELADPGLASLQSPPSAGAAALEALLHESDTIALPSPPAAS